MFSQLRSSVERNQSTETRDAEDLQSLREKPCSLARDNLRHSARIDRPFHNLGAAQLQSALNQSRWEDVLNAMDGGSRAAGPTGVGARDTTPLISTHTAGDTSRAALQKFLRRERSFLFNIWFLSVDSWRETLCQEAPREFRRAREVPSVLSAGEDPVQSNR